MLSRYLDAAGTAPGWLALAAAGVAVVAYCLGCFNGAVVVSRYILRNDVRSHGSGNAGLTNFYRAFGGPLTLAVILTDVLKAVVAVWLGMLWMGQLPNGDILAKYWAGLFCLLGHMFPCMFRFKGGKGILSGGAIAIMIDWRVALVVWGVGSRGWGVGEIAAAFLVLGVLGGLAAGFDGNRICASLVAGCRKMVPGALTIALAAALRLVLAQGGILDTIVHGLFLLVEGLPAWAQLLGMFYANVLLDLLITSGSGHAAVAMPLMVPLADALSLSRQSAVLAFQLGDGLVNLISPVSNTLVGCMALSGVSYPKWLRYFLPLVGFYLAVGTAFMLLAGAVGY